MTNVNFLQKNPQITERNGYENLKNDHQRENAFIFYQILTTSFLRKRIEISLEYWGSSRVIIVTVFYTSDIRSRFITIVLV